jgi:hypothetical protein
VDQSLQNPGNPLCETFQIKRLRILHQLLCLYISNEPLSRNFKTKENMVVSLLRQSFPRLPGLSRKSCRWLLFVSPWHVCWFRISRCSCRLMSISTSNMNAAAKTNDGYFSWLWPSSSSVFAL